MPRKTLLFAIAVLATIAYLVNRITPSQIFNNQYQWVTLKGTVCDRNRYLKEIIVYLRPFDVELNTFPREAIHPSLLKPNPVTHDVDTPDCNFIPNVLTLRSGDSIHFKNSSMVTHNVHISSDKQYFGASIPEQDRIEGPFVAQPGLASFACSIHPWMSGKFMIFDHPYFAVTDADGKFEIKDAPAGKYRIVYRSPDKGYSQGKLGNKGWEITIKAGVNGTMEVEPHEFIVPDAK